MNFTDQEIETIKSLLMDRGSDCPDTDNDALQALGEKLGVYQPIVLPTAEELKRREEMANSPLGIATRNMFARANKYMIESMAENIMAKSFFDGEQRGAKIGTTLRIRLPNDYVVKG